MRARTRNGGAEGRIASLEKGGRRATLEAGGMRITVSVDELDPAVGNPAPTDTLTGVRTTLGRGNLTPTAAPLEFASASTARLQFDRARTVATSLDLRGARVEEALEVLDRYVDDASLAGLGQATIIHGMGTGALRDAVRDHAGAHPLVKSWRPGERGEGGDGATIVIL
jgi:dsDNA-specific endonuclease/ATPase MutS2